MPVFNSKSLGPISYDPDSALEFPRGLPGFDALRRFVPVRGPESDPLIFLQSIEDPEVCFITAPVGAIDPQYDLQLDPEDLAAIGLPARKPIVGAEALCLAVLSVREDGISANLLAPVLVNMRNGKAIQAVSTRSGYSHRHDLALEAVAC